MARVRKSASPNTYLVGEQSLRNFEQHLIEQEQGSAPDVQTDGEREGRRNAPFLQDFVSGLFEQGPQRFECEKPTMSNAENSLSAVIELTERKHDAGHEKRHIGRADDDLR